MAKGLRARQFREPEGEAELYRHYRHRKAFEAGLVAVGAAFVATLHAGVAAESDAELRAGLLLSSAGFLLGFVALFLCHACRMLNMKLYEIVQWAAALSVAAGVVYSVKTLIAFGKVAVG